MSPAVSIASARSSVQARGTTPRLRSRLQSAWNEEDVGDSSSVNSSRYRVLDAHQKQREMEDVERIISDWETQRRYRTASDQTKRSSRRQEAAVVRFRNGCPRLKEMALSRQKSRGSTDRNSFEDMSFEGDQSLPVDRQNPVVDAISQPFQDQVLEELRKLKEAQRREFEAFERLKRGKDEAERKVRRLEQKLREQQRQVPRKEENSRRNYDVKLNSQSNIILHEDSDDEDNKRITSSNNNYDTGDACDTGEEGDPELNDWGDATKSPPPYFTITSPATSPFKRSAGWPAWTGDESLPPGPSSEPQECSSPKRLTRCSRSRNKLDILSLSRSRSSSATSSHVRRLSQSRSRSPSVTRTNRNAQDRQEIRRSCAFFEEKARAEAEAEQRAKETAERLGRARLAAPPQKLLERQAAAEQRKSQQLKELEREMRAEHAREKRAKAREVPLTTYLSAGDAEEAEQKRKERIRQRAKELIQTAELPPRMAVASKKAISDTTLAGEDDTQGRMTVKLKKKLRAALEQEAERQKRRPKPVPNFDQLHSKWEAALKKRKELARRNQDEEGAVNEETEAPKKQSAEFFTSRTSKLAELQEKKEARKQRLQAKEEAIQQHAKRAQEKLLARIRGSLDKNVGNQRKPTKSETLRVQKLMDETAKQQKQRQREEREADARERRREEAARRVRAQVKRSENVRRDNYAGTFVDLKDLDAVAKEKAREQRQQFKEAIARNKEKLLAATAARPSLMERFTTDVKRATHRRAALEAVVKTVFLKDLSTLKGVLTADEQELAREMVASDDYKDDDKTP